ncbi:hypothetical protein LCGC14_1670380 [marine sediment metagenome]|uniref:Uncharacterized protein n=1 Tax=marine sediment metagenome TaxID=412755 RepID=A0A0F9K7C0_9ZZZZ
MPTKKVATMTYLLRANRIKLAQAAKAQNTTTANILADAAKKAIEDAGLTWIDQPELRGKYERES